MQQLPDTHSNTKYKRIYSVVSNCKTNNWIRMFMKTTHLKKPMRITQKTSIQIGDKRNPKDHQWLVKKSISTISM